MNIFVSDPDPKKCAKYLDDRRVNKMIVESCQLLSFAMILNQIPNPPYKCNKKNWLSHPCTKWTAESKYNAKWLINHTRHLLSEYNKRYNTNREHKCKQILDIIELNIDKFPEKEQTSFVNCTKDFKHIENTYEAYKLQLNEKWKNYKVIPLWYRKPKEDSE